MSRLNQEQSHLLITPGGRSLRYSALRAGLWVAVVLVLAACGAAVEPAAEPTGAPAGVAPAVDTVAPTAEPTAMPTAEPTAEPMAMPTAEPTAAATEEASAPPAAQPTVVLSGEAEVEIEDFQFTPKVIVIRVGTEVKWSNKDDVAHTTTSDTGVWDSGYLDKGDEFMFTFTEPGTYPYYCIPHGGPGGAGMSGTVVVVE